MLAGVNSYVFERELGSGAMGTVYLGRKTDSPLPLAIKVLSQDISRDKEAVKRFKREAHIAYQLRHRNIIEVMDHGCSEGRHYIAMEYLGQGDLQARMNSGPIPWQEGVTLTIQILNALQYAHEHGVVHRDIKPANILVDSQRQLVLTDFGVSHLQDGTRLTATGALIGTPEYMAPELFAGGEVDYRVDTYATGLVLYELLTGTHPFRGKTITETVKSVLVNTPPRPDAINPALPANLADLVLRAISRQRDQRPAAAVLARQLGELLATQSVQAEQPLSPPVTAESLAVLVFSSVASEESKGRLIAHIKRTEAPAFQWLSHGALVLYPGAVQALECAREALQQFPHENLRFGLATGPLDSDAGFALEHPELGEFACPTVERACLLLQDCPAGCLRSCPESAAQGSETFPMKEIQPNLFEWAPSTSQAPPDLTPKELAALRLSRLAPRPSRPTQATIESRPEARPPRWAWALLPVLMLGLWFGVWWNWNRPGRLELNCNPSNVKIRLDKAQARPYQSGVPLELVPGWHSLVVTASGFAPLEKKFRVHSREVLKLQIQLKKAKKKK